MSRRSQPERSKVVELREGEKECIGCYLPIHEAKEVRSEALGRWRDRRGQFSCRSRFHAWHMPERER